MIRPHRREPLYLAFILHRISGVGLALFLPLHFWVLSYALTSPLTLDALLVWTEWPLVKFVEFGLVFLLAIHMFGGLRLMAFEFLPWSSGQKTWAAVAVAFSVFIAGIFLLRAVI